MSGWHGVTSVVIGNCGFGFAPCRPEDQDRAMLSLSRNEAVPLKTMRAGHAVGLGDVSRVPRQRRAHAEGRERDVAGAAGAALPVRHRRRQGQGAARHRRRAGRRCASSSSRRWRRAAAVGARRSPATLGNVQRDYDGTPMVTDEMTEREIVAFSRVAAPARPWTDPDHRRAGDRRAHRPRERPADHLERAGADRRGEPARRVAGTRTARPSRASTS